MKRLSFILVVSCNLSYAQPPLPFPIGDVNWTVNFGKSGSSIPDKIYATMGDSTINGLAYQKIGWVENTGLPFEQEDLTYYGSIRDEEGQWLFVPAESTAEFLLYDFTGNVGETIVIENPRWGNGPQEYQVEEIISTPVISGTRRIWILFHTNGGNTEYWIEGIGSINGPFGHALQVFDAGDALICMEQNGELIYRIPEAECCYYLSTAVAERSPAPAVLITPNPATDRIIIEARGADPNKTDLSVSDALGRSINLARTSGMADNWALDISNLPSGIYTLSVALLGGTVMHGRLVVER